MGAQKETLYRTNQFWVFLENKRYRFSKIQNIRQEAEMEEFSVGGVNDRTHIMVSPAKKSGRLVLEGGIPTSDKGTTVYRAGYRLKHPVQIIIAPSPADLDAARIYSVLGGTITKWELSDMDAMSSEILIQKLEIIYENLVLE